MKKIAIHGFYGHGNLGDEAILQALLKELHKHSDVRPALFSSSPQTVSSSYGVPCFQSGARRSFVRTLWEIRTSDLFVLGGGGLLKDYGKGSYNMEAWLGLLQLAQKLRIKTMLYAIGVENIRDDTSRRLLRSVLEKVDLVTVRDGHSKELLREIGIQREIAVRADPAVLLAGGSLCRPKQVSAPPKIILCIRHWFDEGFYIKNTVMNERVIRSLAQALDILIERYNASVDFIPFRTVPYDDDRVAVDQVVSHMRCRMGWRAYDRTPSVSEFMHSAEQGSLVIGMRLHSLILGAAVGTPVIGLEYMPKVKGFMSAIDRGHFSFPMETVTADALVGRVEEILQDYSGHCGSLCVHIAELRKMAETNVGEMVQLARSGRSRRRHGAPGNVRGVH